MISFSRIVSRLETILLVILISITPLLFSGNYLSVYEYPKFLAVSICAFLLILVLLFKPKQKLKRNHIVLVVVLVLLIVFNVTNSTNPFKSLFGDTIFSDSVLAFITYLGVFTYFVYTHLPNKKIFTYINLSGLMLAILTILHFVALNFLDLTEVAYDMRVTATIGQPNILGGYLAAIVPISYYLYKSTIHKKKLYLASTIIIFLGTLLTMSRGAALALIVFGIYEIYKALPSIKLRVMLVLSVVALVSFVVFSPPINVANSNMPYMLRRLLSFKDNSIVYDMRIEIWQNSSRLINEKIFTGWGNSTFQDVYPRYILKSEAPKTIFLEVESSHNFIVDTAVEWGLIVLVLLLGFIIYLVKGQKNHYLVFGLLIILMRSLLNITSVNILLLATIYAALLFRQKKTKNILSVFYKPTLILLSILLFVTLLFVYRIGISQKYELLAKSEGNSNKVTEYYRKGIEANPFKQSLRNKYIALLYWQNDELFVEEAKSSYKSFSDYRSAMYLGLHYLRSGDKQKAINYLLMASDSNNRDPKVFHYLGLIYYSENDYDKSYTNFAKTVELDKKNFSDDYLYLAQINLIRENFEKAKEQVDKAPDSYNKDLILKKLENLKTD